jgi:outer membrane lipoprotein SlyB
MVSTLRIVGMALFVALAAGCAHRQAAPVPPSHGGYYGTQYGVVHSIDMVRAQSQTSGGGAAVGGAIGGLIGNQIEHGHRKAVATTVGILAGAIIGNEIEKNKQGRRDVYRVTVQVERGGLAHFDYASLDNLRVGDRVRIENNQLYRW